MTATMNRHQRNRLSTRAALYDAAVALLEDHDYDDLTVEQICAAAGIGRATFFRHFDRKASLLREFNRRMAASASERLEKRRARSTAQRLRIVQQVLSEAWTRAHPGLRTMALDAVAAMDASGRNTHPELLDLVTAIVRDGLASGELESPLPSELVAFLVVTHMAAAAGYWFEHVDLSLDELTCAALEHCLRGLAP